MADLGQDAPQFELPGDGGERIRLADFRGKFVVLYFYPQDDTETCTAEAIDFSGLVPDFEMADATVIGVSPDSPKKHDKFKAKYELAMRLAADPAREAIDAYGVWGEKTLFGRKYMGVVRSTFLIGRDGKIAGAWRGVKVKGHALEVLEEVKALQR